MEESHQRAPQVERASALVDLGLKACAAYRRPDLARRVEAARERLADPEVRVLVAGEFKQGKSSLVNALLNLALCPVDDDIATSVPTLVRHSPEVTAEAVYEPASEDEPPEVETIDVSTIANFVSEAGNPGNERRLLRVEVGVPRRLLEGGVSLLDTPGVGGLGSAHSAATVGAIPLSDVVFLVTDASQEFTEPELRFLRQARDLCPNVACVLTKIDLYREWRRILELDHDHLARHGFEGLRVFPVSSALRFHALAAEDADLNEESGFAALVAYLRAEVIEDADRLTVRAAANAVLRAGQHLEAQFETERSVLADPEQAARVQAELEATQQRVERLRAESARWQQTLADGVGDLQADVDHDLRARMRTILQEAEGKIDAGDPAEWWPEFETWLRQRASEDVVENYTLLARRADELALTVAEHFAAAEEEIGIGVEIEPPLSVLDDLGQVEVDDAVATPATGVRKKVTAAGSRVFTGMRGAYGGMLMFSMVGGMVGIGAMHPVILGVTLLMGRKSIRDEKQRQLLQRRQQAKAASRRYVDEVSFQVGKDSRDALRTVQRQLRDGFTARAEEIQRTIAERLQVSQQATRGGATERAGRLADVEAELERIRRLIAEARSLAPDLDRSTLPEPGRGATGGPVEP